MNASGLHEIDKLMSIYCKDGATQEEKDCAVLSIQDLIKQAGVHIDIHALEGIDPKDLIPALRK